MGCSQASCRGGIGGGMDDGMHGVTLKFPDGTAETAYVHRRSDQLLASVRMCCALLCLMGLGSFFMRAAFHGLGACTPWDCDTQDPLQRVRMESQWAPIPLSLASALAGVVTKMPCLVARADPAWREVVVAAAATLAMSSQFVASPGYWGQIRGHGSTVGDVEAVNVVLFIDLIVTGSHLTLPIRWFMLLPVQVGSVLLCVAASLGLSSGTNGVQLTLFITVLTVFASAGKRTMERHERQEFKRFINEKILRVETEFQLSQARRQGHAPGEDQRSAAESVPSTSVPSTTESGRAFTSGPGQPLGAEEGVLAGPLPAISRVGLSEQWLIGAGQVQLQPQEVLGEGSYGRVIRGSFLGTPVAVKLPKAAGRRPPQSHLIELCNELRILRRLRHPNVVSLFGALLDSGRGFLAIVLELVEGVSLRDFISPPRGGAPSSGACGGSAGGGEETAASVPAAASAPGDVVRVTVLADISCALWYLHTRHPLIVHGDLKDSNVFVESCGGLHERLCRAKLLDFGLSRAITKHARPLGGTLHWMAPEVIQREDQALSTAADVFSFGRLAFFVVTGLHPAAQMTRCCILELTERGQLPQLRWPREEGGLTRSFRGVAESCYAFDPAARPRIMEVHPVLSAWLGNAGVQRYGGTRAGQAQGPQEGVPGAAGRAPAQSPDGGPGEEEAGGGARPAADTYILQPRFGLTPWVSQTGMLVEALMRCNVEVPQTSCCFFHAWVWRLGSLSRKLQQAPCKTHRGDEVVGQCGACGVLVLAADILGEGGSLAQCAYCNEEVVLTTEI